MQSCAGRKPDRNLLENFSFGKLVRHYTLLQSFPKKHSCLAIIAIFSHFSHGSWERMSRMSWMSRMSRMSRIRHEMVPQWAMLAQMLHFRRWLFRPRDLRMRNDNDQVSQYPGRSPAQSLEAPEFLVNCHWQTVFLMFFLIFHSVRVFINILPEPGWLMLASLFQEKMNPCQLYCAAGRRQAHVTKVANAALPVSMHNLCTLSQDWTPLNQVEQAAEGSKGRQSNHVILHCYLKNFSEDSKAFKGILLGFTIPLLVFFTIALDLPHGHFWMFQVPCRTRCEHRQGKLKDWQVSNIWIQFSGMKSVKHRPFASIEIALPGFFFACWLSCLTKKSETGVQRIRSCWSWLVFYLSIHSFSS